MFLAIDIGNSNIHFGLFDGGLVRTWRCRSVPTKTADEYAALLRGYLASVSLGLSDVDSVGIACVVPALARTFEELTADCIDVAPLIIGPGVKTGVNVRIDNPIEVGADRVANAAAAHRQFGGPAVVVDFGTSTNFDVINEAGDYVGGVISIGLGLAHDALVSRAARLVTVELKAPPSVVGRNTTHAMQSGLFLGYVGMIEGLLSRILGEVGRSAHVLATGGLASLFAAELPSVTSVAPNLTLDGIRVIAELNASSTRLSVID